MMDSGRMLTVHHLYFRLSIAGPVLGAVSVSVDGQRSGYGEWIRVSEIIGGRNFDGGKPVRQQTA
jgi:hypothetical protein